MISIVQKVRLRKGQGYRFLLYPLQEQFVQRSTSQKRITTIKILQGRVGVRARFQIKTQLLHSIDESII